MRKRRPSRYAKLASSAGDTQTVPPSDLNEMDDAMGKDFEVHLVGRDTGPSLSEKTSRSSLPTIQELAARQLSIDLADALETISLLEGKLSLLHEANSAHERELSHTGAELDRLNSEMALMVRRLIEAERNASIKRGERSVGDNSLHRAIELSERNVMSRLVTVENVVKDGFSSIDKKMAELGLLVTKEISVLQRALNPPVEMNPSGRQGGVARVVNAPFKFIERRHKKLELTRLVEESGFFDSRWYLEQYPEVISSGLRPIKYFINYGLNLNHDPGPNFSCEKYLAKYSDVSKSSMPAFLHFLRYGRLEGRLP